LGGLGLDGGKLRRGPFGGLSQQVSGLLLRIRQRRGRLVAGLVPYLSRMRVGLRENPAGQLDRARVPGRRRGRGRRRDWGRARRRDWGRGRRRDWGRGRRRDWGRDWRRDWGRLASGPARIVVGAQ